MTFKISWIWYELLVQYVFEYLKAHDICPVLDFQQAMCNIQIAIFWLSWLIFGQKTVLYTHRVNFLHKRIVHKKFQLKFPTLNKNDCSATSKLNRNEKKFTQDQLRNVQKY